ncbi:MAG: hypothetical protein IGS03_04900 [Candidatus Sericytochromatia bacterium]|nr:hypothetical protein [Candidatus Sericytochromatia bacterium]
MSPQNWLRLATLCFVLSLPLSIWSLWQGRYSEALFQFFLGASVALLLRRRGEMKVALLRQATAQNAEPDDAA